MFSFDRFGDEFRVFFTIILSNSQWWNAEDMADSVGSGLRTCVYVSLSLKKKKKEVGAENSDLFGEKSHRDPDFLHSLGSTFFKSNPNNENSNYYNIYYFSCLSGFTQYVRYHNLCFSSICSSGRRSFDTIKCAVAGFCLYALAWSSQFRKKMLYNVREK